MEITNCQKQNLESVLWHSLLPDLLKNLKKQIKECQKAQEYPDDISWNLQEGVLLSWGDAQTIVDFIENR